MSEPVKVAILPKTTDHLVAVLEAVGAEVTELSDAEALIWTDSSPAGFPSSLPYRIRWVQLKSAGVQQWITTGTVDQRRQWTSAVGAYSLDVAEHAVGQLIAGLRQFPLFARQTTWTKKQNWTKVASLRGRRVAIVGAGSIGRACIPLLTAFGAEVIAVNRSGRQVEGALRTLTSESLEEALGLADDAIIAGASTEETFNLMGAAQLAQIGPEGFLVNIARGNLVDTEALVAALRSGELGGAALDVTEPEPLPDDHPLWHLPNVLITPHVANPLRNVEPHFAVHAGENLRRFAAGKPLQALIDLNRKY